MAHEKSTELLVSIRRIIRAVDIHSKDLLKQYGMTGPQLMILKVIDKSPNMSVSEIAASVSLSQATVTNILSRLEQQGDITRRRGSQDKRKVYIETSERTRAILQSNPSLLQVDFVQRFNSLKDWEQSLLLSSVQRIADMMDVKETDASPNSDDAWADVEETHTSPP